MAPFICMQTCPSTQVYIDKTEAYYRKHGGKTVVLARFIPIVRTFAPFVAGVGRMAYRSFALYNVGGAAVWTLSFTLAGYYFGACCTARCVRSCAYALHLGFISASASDSSAPELCTWPGNFPFVKHNFTLVVVAIVAVSVLPVLFEVRRCSLSVLGEVQGKRTSPIQTGTDSRVATTSLQIFAARREAASSQQNVEDIGTGMP